MRLITRPPAISIGAAWETSPLSVSANVALPWWRRLGYRLYRHPAVMFGLGPTYTFVCQHRFPIGLTRGGLQPWISTMGTNLAVALVAAGMIWLVGVGPFLLVHGPIILLAASIGVWLFYVQHQFEETLWEHDGDWSFHEAALHGSSHYDLPSILRWFTANIGVHHVHHLASRIPYYHLPEVLRQPHSNWAMKRKASRSGSGSPREMTPTLSRLRIMISDMVKLR